MPWCLWTGHSSALFSGTPLFSAALLAGTKKNRVASSVLKVLLPSPRAVGSQNSRLHTLINLSYMLWGETLLCLSGWREGQDKWRSCVPWCGIGIWHAQTLWISVPDLSPALSLIKVLNTLLIDFSLVCFSHYWFWLTISSWPPSWLGRPDERQLSNSS